MNESSTLFSFVTSLSYAPWGSVRDCFIMKQIYSSPEIDVVKFMGIPVLQDSSPIDNPGIGGPGEIPIE